MKYKSLLLSEASGSVGGLTFSHNKGGLYIRARAIPTNPGSPQQDVVRAAFGALVSRWITILTEVQREAWRSYAAGTPLLDTLGDVRHVTGMNMFLRCNALRVAFGLGVVDDGPIYHNLGYLTAPTFSVAAAADTVSVGFNNLDGWANETGSHLLVYASRPQNVSVNYFKGPYRLAGTVDGDDVTPPVSPEVIDLPFPVSADQRVFFMAAASRLDGRRSLDFRNFAIAV